MTRYLPIVAAAVLLVLLAAPTATLAQQDVRGDDDCLVITPRNRHQCCEETAALVFETTLNREESLPLPSVGDSDFFNAYYASRQAFSDCYFGNSLLLGLPAHFRLLATGVATSTVRFRLASSRPARLAVYRGRVHEGTLLLNGVPVADLAADFLDDAARAEVPVLLEEGWNTLELLGAGPDAGSVVVIPLAEK